LTAKALLEASFVRSCYRLGTFRSVHAFLRGQPGERAVRLYYLVGILALSACAVQQQQSAPPPVATAPDASVNATGGTEIGKASIYSKSLAGKTTASGTPLDASADVAASNSLPLGSKAKVTNLETGKSAVVTVEDRGKLPKCRVDLTPATAQKIGLSQKQGVAPVAVQPVAASEP
jgi:rare lipoprotein A